MEKDVVVVIADIRGSRKMDSNARYEGQLYLKSTIVQVNENYGRAIVAPFMITRGDEFQGCVKDLRTAFEIVLELERLLFPLKLRYGIGRGEIQRMGSNITIEMDGPAFHRASESLQVAKKRKYGIVVSSDDKASDMLLNNIFLLMGAIKSRWNKINFGRYWKYKELGTYERVALQEKVSAQAIWDSMQNMRVSEVLQAEQNLFEYFDVYSCSSDKLAE